MENCYLYVWIFIFLIAGITEILGGKQCVGVHQESGAADQRRGRARHALSRQVHRRTHSQGRSLIVCLYPMSCRGCFARPYVCLEDGCLGNSSFVSDLSDLATSKGEKGCSMYVEVQVTLLRTSFHEQQQMMIILHILIEFQSLIASSIV